MPMKTLSRPTSLFTTASLSQPSWTPSRPSHAEATQPRDVSSLRTPWTRLLCLPNPTTPACRPWSMTKVCCCGKRPIGLGACTARPHCLLGASKKSRPAWPGSMAAGSSEAGRRLGRRPQSSSPDHSRSEKPVPPEEQRGLALRREPPSRRSTAVNLCVAMCRGHSSMRVVASLFISFLRFHFSGFPFHLCAVDAFFLLQFQATGSSVEVLHRQNRFAASRGLG